MGRGAVGPPFPGGGAVYQNPPPDGGEGRGAVGPRSLTNYPPGGGRSESVDILQYINGFFGMGRLGGKTFGEENGGSCLSLWAD